jgi:PAS domain S-box-containing protein
MISSTLSEKDEEKRLEALTRYNVLDSLPEQGYEDVTKLAASICGTPISLISLIDRDRQWFKSERGLGVRQTPRSQSFCANTIGTAHTLIVEDATKDSRFRDNPLVLGDPNIRFYAGAPIVEKNGHVLGTVCVIDTQPRVLTDDQISSLEALARQVMALLEQRDTIARLEEAANAADATDQIIRANERRLQSYVDSFLALAWVANAEGWITWYNRRWYEYTGTAPKEMEGWGWQSVHDSSMLPSVLERWTGSIKTKTPFEMVFPLRGADGVYRSFLTRVIPIRNEHGDVIEWFGTNTEVDELQKARIALETSEAVLNQVMTATTDAVVSVNRDWIVTYLNPTAELLYGSSKNLVGRNLWEVFPNSLYGGSPFVEYYNHAMHEGIAGKFEAEYGEPVNITIGLEVYPSKNGIVVFSRDITKIKIATAAVLRNEKLAAVGRLASSIAHEIKNPLEAVTNLLYLARTSQNLEEAIPYLGNAELELRRASAITQQTLRFHRQTTRPTRITFAELVEGIFTGQHSRLTNSHIQVKERNRAVHPVLCLEGEIRQVFNNFVSNAIDAMRGLGGTLYIRGRDGRDWKTGEPGMVLTIADTGTGMSELTRSRIFEAFYTTKGVGGSGLGLWISQEIVDRHHGILRLKTSQRTSSSGTVFTLFLPQDAIQYAASIKT